MSLPRAIVVDLLHGKFAVAVASEVPGVDYKMLLSQFAGPTGRKIARELADAEIKRGEHPPARLHD